MNTKLRILGQIEICLDGIIQGTQIILVICDFASCFKVLERAEITYFVIGFCADAIDNPHFHIDKNSNYLECQKRLLKFNERVS